VEKDWNYLQGSALLMKGNKVLEYHAIPHQALTVTPDGLLNLDGLEYSKPATELLAQGLASKFSGLSGKMAVCTLDSSIVPTCAESVDVHVKVWNQNETLQSRDLSFRVFDVWDMTQDLRLDLARIFTPKWQMEAQASGPVWAVFYQETKAMSWGEVLMKKARPPRRDEEQRGYFHFEPGSLLVFPLIDNDGQNTMIKLVNHGDADVWLFGWMIMLPRI
jgi:hypothetical protein